MSRFLSSSVLINVASVAAAIAIFVAPFRASAGLRGAMLVIAALVIVCAYARAGQLAHLLPKAKFLALAVGLWLLAATLWSFAAPQPMASLSVVKRDILTPILACLVFYALTRTRADMLRWLAVLTLSLAILTVMIIRDPFDPLATLQESDYLTVGLLTTWIVTLAPLMAVLLFASRPWRARARLLAIIVLPCLLISAWLSGNRTVWVCFASMLIVAAVLATRARAHALMIPKRTIATLAVALGVLAMFMFAAMQYRADTQAPSGTTALGFLLHDSRAPILRAAVEMIIERPWQGLGYANPQIHDAFAARFDLPWLRNYVHHPHNVVLNHMLQMGFIGGLVILLLFAALAQTFITKSRAVGLTRFAGLCGAALVVGVFLRNMTDDFFQRHTVQFFGAAVGMLLGLAARRPPLTG